MCGIAGYFGTSTLPNERVERCLAEMHRRGPDAAAHHHAAKNGRNVYLLSSRLSIIDLDERSNQPFHLGSKTLSYNGELYNYVELKKNLLQKGVRFKSESDTEVLLQHLMTSGLDGIQECEGMWSFALYDQNEGSLVLSRDRFGEKPLYYFEDSTGIYFGSEVKLIFALLGRRLPIHRNHVRRFLVNGYKSLYKTRETFFEGLKEVPPATLFMCSPQGKLESRRYWTPKFAPDDSMTFEKAVQGAREKLIHSVDLRLRADVPLAFCMSGGIDSNALMAIAKKACKYDVHGFTIANTDARYEEQSMVDCAVKELGLKHTSVKLTTENFVSELRELVRYHDAPVYTISSYTQWLLMRNIHEHGYKISIGGYCADELFTGYYDHHLAYLYEIKKNEALWETSRKNWMTHIKPIVRNPFLGDPDAFLKNPKMRDHIYLDAAEFQAYLTEPLNEPFEERTYTDDLLRNRMLNEVNEETIPVFLHEEDLNAMYYSIENRSPFLDSKLFEFCYSIPTQLLIRDGKNKVILREAMRGLVPDAILDNRRKVGFNAPILDLLDPKTTKELLKDSPIFEILRRDRIETLLSKSRAEMKESESKFVFYFLTSKLFMEEFAT